MFKGQCLKHHPWLLADPIIIHHTSQPQLVPSWLLLGRLGFPKRSQPDSLRKNPWIV